MPNENNRLSDHAEVRPYTVELGRRIAAETAEQYEARVTDKGLDAMIDHMHPAQQDGIRIQLAIDAVIDDRIRQDNAGAMYEARNRMPINDGGSI